MTELQEPYRPAQPKPAPQAVRAQLRPIIPHQGPVILLFGIMGIIMCMPYGILAWVWGHHDLKQMRAGLMNRSGERLTQAGMICGVISVLLPLAWGLIAAGAALARGGWGSSL